MPRTLVNIVSTVDPLPSYLFIKEYFQPDDRVMFISSRKEGEQIDFFVKLLKINGNQVDDIVLKRNDDEFTYERICRRLHSQLEKNRSYWVNLAGGSRYMALAVHQAFESFDAKFFYVQTRENIIVNSIFDDSIYDNDDIFYPIGYRMSLAEYFEAHGLLHDISSSKNHQPICSKQQTDRFFDLFVRHQFSSSEYDAIGVLRKDFRGRVKKKRIGDLERAGAAGLSSLLRHLAFVPSTPDCLNADEIDYLTGGWFEEYVFFLMNQLVAPQDIAIGVHISRPLEQHNNELDVCFIKANKLYVIECKTGVQSDHMFNEIVYKACALREALLGMTCQSYIFSLKRDVDGALERVARIMDIKFCSSDVLTRSDKMKSVAEDMVRLSHE